ncbi:MAG: FAD-dependent monooxygenase [Kutzneria sp.]|nr:FAD-dependent monooxygenase [Kutzneria sp.]MBV9844778.1 FAD-dependent monooxygenase [Kutzneria sp.]
MAVDVVVCGAGVAGLATACAIGRLGLRVLLLDKQRERRPIAKGEVLQPGSLPILHDWNVLQGLQERDAVRLNRLVIREADGTGLLDFDYGMLADGRAWMLAHDYQVILDALTDCLADTVQWRRGVLVEGTIMDSAGRVAGVRVVEAGRRYEVRAPLVVGADGMSSRLRKAAGITVNPIEYHHKLMSFDISGIAEQDDEVAAYVTDRGLHLRYPLPGGRVRLYAEVSPDRLRVLGRAGLAEWIEGLLAEVPALRPLGDPLRASLDRRQILSVRRFTSPRLQRPGLALVGEAVHAVHPMAAQGMNSAIADANALAGCLAAAGSVDPESVDGALRSYHDERIGLLHQIATMSHNATRMMTGTSRGGRMLGRRMLRGTAGNPRLRFLVTYNLSGLGMRPLGTTDRLYQVGLLPDRHAHQVPVVDWPAGLPSPMTPSVSQ